MPDEDNNLSFSQRYGYTPIKTKIQLESMDNNLRNSLWNLLVRYVFYEEGERNPILVKIVSIIWEYFLKWNLQRQISWYMDIKRISGEFFKWEWYTVYNFFEFIAGVSSGTIEKRFIPECNLVLKRELSAYRFVGYKITRITSETEIEAIETALQSPYGSVNQHLETALNLLSDRKNPDYRNSMKESISAVEALSRIIGEDPNNTLGRLLNWLEEEKELHRLLNKGFTALYHYTSDADGIRHGLTDDSTVGYEDAIYLLVTCSAFVNYLIAKYGAE